MCIYIQVAEAKFVTTVIFKRYDHNYKFSTNMKAKLADLKSNVRNGTSVSVLHYAKVSSHNED